ncbi:hypothetical protein [Streptomyces sp. AK02-04a]|nr:hypothetical protein [Streptomyces sp. AK02-04a]MDX3762062.1 hypothetical protein [Streptomyces sp. AK02-04a]
MPVPVDRDMLIRRWYVHRIRLDSESTVRTRASARSPAGAGLERSARSFQ